MRTKVAAHIQACHICQVVKADHHRPRGLMERVELPIQKCQSLGMDWIVKLPVFIRDGRAYDSVLTVVDRATKLVAIVPTWSDATAVDTADQFLHYWVTHHGLPSSIISDRDGKFMSAFW